MADADAPTPPEAVLDAVLGAMSTGQVHASHPAYFGMFHPAPAALGVIGDAIVSGFNPQLATRGNAPFAVDLERALIHALGRRMGYPADAIEGAFTHGGAEAHLTAVAAALDAKFPALAEGGLRALAGQPRLYVSAEGHPTVARAARISGLGRDGVRVVPVDAEGRVKLGALSAAITEDERSGYLPFMVCATAGTTATASIDPLPELAALARRRGLWLHVDAAWGGLAKLAPSIADSVQGIDLSDSMIIDPHKILAAPIGVGLYLSRRVGVLGRLFDQRAGYMPRDASSDPYAHSLSWSRRALGVKVFLPLAALGFRGLGALLDRQVALGAHLRERLVAAGFRVLNATPLPLVCFVAQGRDDGASPALLDAVARATIAEGAGWLSVTRMAGGQRALRAAIVSHRTTEADVDRLVEALARARDAHAPSDVGRSAR